MTAVPNPTVEVNLEFDPPQVHPTQPPSSTLINIDNLKVPDRPADWLRQLEAQDDTASFHSAISL